MKGSVVHELWDAVKELYARMAVPLAPVQIPSQRHLPGCNFGHICDKEVKPEALHRSPDIYHRAEENSGKPQLMKVVPLFIASNGAPYLQIMSVRAHSMSG